jgi:glycogen debranching enzyme
VYQGYTVLVTNPDGTCRSHSREGLFDFDTRILSTYRITLDGRAPEHVSSGTLGSERWSAKLRVHRAGKGPDGPRLPQDALELTLERRVGRGMEERLLVRNHSMAAVETSLVLELEADFADVQEIGVKRRQEGKVQVDWDAAARTLLFDYHVKHEGRALHRALRVRVVHSDRTPAAEGSSLCFPVRLPPRGEWRAILGYHSLVDGQWREPLPEWSEGGAEGLARRVTERDRVRQLWRAKRSRLETADPLVGPAFERAAEDLFALRNWEYDEAPDAWFPMAGVPTYTGLFGRDSLTAAWQGALLGPEMMQGTLAVIARTQATKDDAFRDEEPGKLIHEMRRGPLSELDIIPQRAYYGTQTTPAMFVLTLSEYWHWTGDESLLRRYRDAALRTFKWVERHGDRDGDGFLEYVKRSPKGLKNQAWKDSDEAIRYHDGTQVPNPIATIEEQAYHFIALQRMAEQQPGEKTVRPGVPKCTRMRDDD